MKKARDITSGVSLLLFFCCFIAGSGATDAATVKEKSWSFEFKSIPVTEAIAKISKTSGVKIVLHGDADKSLLTRSYKDYTIERVLTDVLSGENIAALFQYAEYELSSVHIWILPKPENGNINAGMLPVSAHSNQITSDSTVMSLHEYREIQEFVQESGIQPEVIISGNQEDVKKASEDIKKDYIYFKVLPRKDGSSSLADGNHGDSSSGTGENAGAENQEIIVPPSPDPEKLRGLEPPPMPPGFITVNK